MSQHNIISTDWISVARSFDTLRETDICTTDKAESRNLSNRVELPECGDVSVGTEYDSILNVIASTNFLESDSKACNMTFCEANELDLVSDDNIVCRGDNVSMSGRESPYENILTSAVNTSQQVDKSSECDSRIDQMLSGSAEESLERLSSNYYDDDSNDLLFEELTNEVVSALTEGLDYDKWSRENLTAEPHPYHYRVEPNINFREHISTDYFNDLSHQSAEDNSNLEANVRRAERLRTTVDREKALQWAQRLDRLISGSACLLKHPVWGSSVDGEEFMNEDSSQLETSTTDNVTEPQKRKCHKCVSAWYGGGDAVSIEDVTKSQELLNSDVNMNYDANQSNKEDIFSRSKAVQTEYPSVSYQTGTVCNTLEAAQDILSTRYALPDVIVKKAIITWSRWNILDLVRSPSNQSDLWNPDKQPSLQLSQLLSEMKDINDEIERREDVIARLLSFKTEKQNFHSESFNAEDEFEENEASGVQQQCNQIKENIAHEKQSSRIKNSSTAGRTDADTRNKSVAPRSAIVNNSVQFLHRWIRFIFRTLSRHRNNHQRHHRH